MTACREPNAQMPSHSAHGPGRDRIKSEGSSARATLYNYFIMSEHETSNLDASDRENFDDIRSEEYAAMSDDSMS